MYYYSIFNSLIPICNCYINTIDNHEIDINMFIGIRCKYNPARFKD